ncbi:hypothetical protein DDE18_16780 [Nocardioides gansuensis]|uniref:DUF1353 domain-containing protein n=1 Tax=Nocardioides gansuensis TaxID=2138300 RepID=A0A2T8F7I1_9ACTN|nr:DUF1353 domain-containing protein [Nocardioides gansuensis]PVG81649.1 hypothetical protein DDE18_16780 [Nocardioides gansuensis]
MRARVLEEQVRVEARRFYDGGALPDGDSPEVPPAPGHAPRIVLERHAEQEIEVFSMERRLAYLDRHLGELLVPAARGFRTDLTSVPALFTWLVPKTGAHLPAALLHDGLVGGEDGASYVSTEGHRLSRVEADRVFRDAMADTGTGVVRRWIVWSAVTLATIFVGSGTARTAWGRWALRAGVGATLLLIVHLGYSATADLFDRSWPLAWQVPWMGDRSWWVEVAGGLAAAIVVPLVLCAAWGRFWPAGAIGGVMLAVLLHVTVGLAVITLGYQAVEWVARRAPWAARLLLVGVVTVALATFAWLVGS